MRHWRSKVLLALIALVSLGAQVSEASAALTPPPGRPTQPGWVDQTPEPAARPFTDESAFASAPVTLAPATPVIRGRAPRVTDTATRRCQIDSPDHGVPRWATIRDQPSLLVIGNCRNGTLIYQQKRNDDNTWSFSYVTSGYYNCGWIFRTVTTILDHNYNSHCVNASTAPERSAYAFYSNCPRSGCSDGSPVYLKANCPAYANVNPLKPHTAPTDYTWTHPAGEYLLWRYVTADNQFVMARDPGISDGDGNWEFYPGWCFDSAQFTTLNPYQVTFYRQSAA